MNKKPTILIIDDEKDFCHFMKMNLESTNKYKILVSTNAKSGIKTAIRKKPDLVLLDIMMPNMSGFEVLQKLKENVNTTSTPVIMVTALDDDESVERAMGLYSYEYIVKPVEMDSLMSKIDKALFSL